jgi:hypothetical protein
MPQALRRPLSARREAGPYGGASSADRREVVSFNTRRIIALVVVLLGSTVGGLLAMTLSDWWVAVLVGVVLGVVVGVALVLIWANQSL